MGILNSEEDRLRKRISDLEFHVEQLREELTKILEVGEKYFGSRVVDVISEGDIKGWKKLLKQTKPKEA